MTPLVLTQGDPAGIGPEIALRAWLERKRDDPPFLLFADPDHLVRLAARLGWAVPVVRAAPEDACAIFAAALPVAALHHAVAGEPGAPSLQDGLATIEAIDRALALVRQGRARALVTNPINKAALYAAGFTDPGHTEYLGRLAARDWGWAGAPVMMLWAPELAVVPATIHIPLAAAPAALSIDLLVATGRTVAHDLCTRFAIKAPRLAVCGLNPHAGEGGAIGREEIDIIAPAIAVLRAEGVDATGPHSADTLFHAAARARYDCAIAMYHDQALIPIKTLAFDHGVNVTLGLPFVRTSPDHGTAYDIAGRGIAEATSLKAALALADRLSR